MRDLPRLAPVFALVFPVFALVFTTSTLFAQTTVPNVVPAEPVSVASGALNQEAPNRTIKYFSLEHRTPAEMENADRDLLQARHKELALAAEIYGYDITAGTWVYDQAICPQFPDTLLLHYLDKFPDGSESLFTALVPRGAGRVNIVPVLYRNAVPYHSAVKNNRSFAIFNAMVPPATAKKDSSAEGKWLSLGVCYAEVVGGRPNVPDDPSLDSATIEAPVATYRLDAAKGQSQIQFSDREAANIFKIWTISLNPSGQVTAAENEDYATYVARIVQPPAPSGKTAPNPPAPPSRITPVPSKPPQTITPQPPAPQ
jgi:hypothetical protein